MNVITYDNKTSFTPKAQELPDAQIRRRQYWEGEPENKVSRPDIEPLAGIRFLIDRIYCDGSINLSSSIGAAFSAEEFMGILFRVRDELISIEHDRAVGEDDPESLDWPIKSRMMELKTQGFSPDQINKIVRLEYPDYIRMDIVARQKIAKRKQGAL